MKQTDEMKQTIQEWCEIFKNDNPQQVVAALADGDDFDDIHFDEILNFEYPPYNSEDYDAYRKQYKKCTDKVDEFLKSLGYKHIDQEGGGEGGSEYVEGIFSIQGKIYKANWAYYSHYGYDYEGINHSLHEVKPVTKTVVVYE